jgi:hypothetical protein
MFATRPDDLETINDHMLGGGGPEQVSRTLDAAHSCASGYSQRFAQYLDPSRKPSENPTFRDDEVHHAIYPTPAHMDFLHLATDADPSQLCSKNSIAHETEKTPLSINCDLRSQANDLNEADWLVQYLPGPTELEGGKIAHSILATRKDQDGLERRLARTDLDNQPSRAAAGQIFTAWELCTKDPKGSIKTWTGTGATMATAHKRQFIPGSYTGMQSHVSWLGLSAARMQGPGDGDKEAVTGDDQTESESQALHRSSVHGSR